MSVLLERFWAKVDKTDDCWLWTAAKLPTGYGCFQAGSTRYAHRFAYERFVAPIPDDHEVHHTCGRPSCVNPDHLRAVTRREHRALDDVAQQAGRASGEVRRAKTHCKHGHPFDAENTYRWRGTRVCRACHAARERARRAAA